MMNSESSFFSRMLFNYPVHIHHLSFQMLLSVTLVILFAACAGVALGGKKRATPCISSGSPYLIDACPCVLGTCMLSWGPVQGARRGGNAVLLTGSVWLSLPLFSKDSSLLPQLVTKIMSSAQGVK